MPFLFLPCFVMLFALNSCVHYFYIHHYWLDSVRWLVVRDKYAREAVEVQMSYQHNPDFWTGLPLLGVEDQHPN